MKRFVFFVLFLTVISVVTPKQWCTSTTYCPDGYHCCFNNTRCCLGSESSEINLILTPREANKESDQFWSKLLRVEQVA